MNINLAPDLPKIIADQGQLQHAITNIIINAEYFMQEAHKGGTLTIATEKIDNIIRASFMDDGPGIDKDVLLRIFDPFFSTKGIGQGVGLGLSV